MKLKIYHYLFEEKSFFIKLDVNDKILSIIHEISLILKTKKIFIFRQIRKKI